MAKKNLAQAAQAATDHFFTGSVEAQSENVRKPSETAQEGRQADRTGKTSSTNTSAETGAQAAQNKRVTTKGKSTDDVKVFSFRAWIDDVEEWRLYAAVKGMKVDDLGAAAMREYIKRHPIKEEEKMIQQAMMIVRAKKSKSVKS